MPYLIESRYKGIDVEVTPYLYRKRPGSIVESTSVDVRGLDSFWLISYMLDECTRAGMPVNQCIYDTTIRLMGPLLVGRTLALKPDERRDLFIACCNLIQRQKEFSRLRLKGSEYWVDVETALKTYNYRLWATGIFGVAMCEGGLGLKSAVSLVKESLRCPIS